MQGALYQMLNHGVSTGALFLFVGFIYERRHTRTISEFGGLATPMPWFSTLFVIASLSSIGIAVPERVCRRVSDPDWNVDVAGVSQPVAHYDVRGDGCYLGGGLHALDVAARAVGKITNPENARLKDLNSRELGLILPLLILMLFMGVYPRVFLDRRSPAWTYAREFLRAPAEGSYTTEVRKDWTGFICTICHPVIIWLIIDEFVLAQSMIPSLAVANRPE
jgi:NADH-quinone oxidoreductase subunit M